MSQYSGDMQVVAQPTVTIRAQISGDPELHDSRIGVAIGRSNIIAPHLGEPPVRLMSSAARLAGIPIEVKSVGNLPPVAVDPRRVQPATVRWALNGTLFFATGSPDGSQSIRRT